jgi:hypothetical protein
LIERFFLGEGITAATTNIEINPIRKLPDEKIEDYFGVLYNNIVEKYNSLTDPCPSIALELETDDKTKSALIPYIRSKREE